jgi:hypothetical protein
MNKKLRQQVYDKYGGRCAYSGTPLEPDWQVDHRIPKRMYAYQLIKNLDDFDNLMPCQRSINNYKFSYSLEDFRSFLLGKLHLRLRKYPHSGKGGELRKRMEKIAAYFDITPDKPFYGVFYFEKTNNG